MDNIKIKSLGPIKEADINFGDLTFFVGPQASGKSIALQLIKLIADKNTIETRLTNYGYVWGTIEEDNLERFFGEGTSGIWNRHTEIRADQKMFAKNALLPMKPGNDNDEKESIFYIPAQRVLCLGNGWPRFFTEYDISVPYVLRDFSEVLRNYLEVGFSHAQSPVFPQSNEKVNGQLTNAFHDSIFNGGEITVDRSFKKRLLLEINGLTLPFMTWSSGQKEFIALMMGVYWLCPPNADRRKDITTVIIEEPEMGLHPEAIKSILLQVMELLSRGYKVIISTHSPVLLEFAWAFNFLQSSNGGDAALLELLGLDSNAKTEPFVKEVLQRKTISTYYFDSKDYKTTVTDISSLYPGDENSAIAEWGGLSSFASKANDIVSTIAANNG
jgi:energy-coupling factor transporter ATP-binding protein EcfA2